MQHGADTLAIGVPDLASDCDVVDLSVKLDLVSIREAPLGQDRFNGFAELEEHRGFRTHRKRGAVALRGCHVNLCTATGQLFTPQVQVDLLAEFSSMFVEVLEAASQGRFRGAQAQGVLIEFFNLALKRRDGVDQMSRNSDSSGYHT